MYIEHLTLSTGHLSRIERGDVSGETLGRVAPWLGAIVESGKYAPLPVSGLAQFGASAAVYDGALVVTIFGESGVEGVDRAPLVTLGVARRHRHGPELWALLRKPGMPRSKDDLSKPQEPWGAAIIWPTIALHMEALEWLGDLERCICWAWCARSEDRQ